MHEFPLPSLGPKLEAIRDDVVNGKGFHLIQGMSASAEDWPGWLSCPRTYENFYR